MKMKNLMNLHIMLLTLVVSSALILGSCTKDDPIVEGDKTELTALIAQADALAASASSTDYPAAAITDFKAVLASVKTAQEAKVTQAQITNLKTQLDEALKTFDSKAYGFIDESMYLNAGWHFDEGTGTTATAYSTVKHVGTFKKGWTTVLGSAAALPTWIEGVKGGKAIYLNNGAHLEVPYTTAFLPASITISAWIKMDAIWENDIIVSQNYWWGYKFQTQGNGFLMFTERMNASSVQDKDDGGVAVDLGVWSHVVVSLNSTTKTLKFYRNGVLTQTFTELDNIGPLTQTLSFVDGDNTYEAQPFLIGSLATDAELAAHPLNFNWITSANLGSFKGAIDELKIYNIAVTDGQVSKLYNDEKP